jgi:hypothetical protein
MPPAAAQRTEFGTAFKTLSAFEETEGVKDILGDRISALRRTMTTELELWVSGQQRRRRSRSSKRATATARRRSTNPSSPSGSSRWRPPRASALNLLK